MISDVLENYKRKIQFDKDRVMIKYNLYRIKLNVFFVLGVYG